MSENKVTVYWPEKHMSKLKKIEAIAKANERATSSMLRLIVMEWLENLEKEKEKKNA